MKVTSLWGTRERSRAKDGIPIWGKGGLVSGVAVPLK
jgi:hypothetical protein